jgi:hypothetical protein
VPDAKGFEGGGARLGCCCALSHASMRMVEMASITKEACPQAEAPSQRRVPTCTRCSSRACTRSGQARRSQSTPSTRLRSSLPCEPGGTPSQDAVNQSHSAGHPTATLVPLNENQLVSWARSRPRLARPDKRQGSNSPLLSKLELASPKPEGVPPRPRAGRGGYTSPLCS